MQMFAMLLLLFTPVKVYQTFWTLVEFLITETGLVLLWQRCLKQ